MNLKRQLAPRQPACTLDAAVGRLRVHSQDRDGAAHKPATDVVRHGSCFRGVTCTISRGISAAARCRPSLRRSDFRAPLDIEPTIDGYFDDWPIEVDSLRTMRGVDGPIRFVIGQHGRFAYLYAEVTDSNIVFATPSTAALDDGPRIRGPRVTRERESAGPDRDVSCLPRKPPARSLPTFDPDSVSHPSPTVQARWQDVPGGYQGRGAHTGEIARYPSWRDCRQHGDRGRRRNPEFEFCRPGAGAFRHNLAQADRSRREARATWHAHDRYGPHRLANCGRR